LRIGGSGKKSRSYHSELEDLTENELKDLARKGGETGQRAKQMLKLIRDRDRLRNKRNKS
jgi:hypothetical protein